MEDGDLGYKSRLRLAEMPVWVLAIVDHRVKEYTGMSYKDLLLNGGGGFTLPDLLFMPKDQVERLALELCSLNGREDMAPIMNYFTAHEAEIATVNGEIFYNCLSTNGSSRGLTQFQPPAWEDSRKYLRKIGSFIELGDYVKEVYFPASNLLACLGYLLLNESILLKLGVPVNAETLYLCHNQGTGFFSKGKITGYKGQSAEVRAMIDRYRKRK